MGILGVCFDLGISIFGLWKVFLYWLRGDGVGSFVGQRPVGKMGGELSEQTFSPVEEEAAAALEKSPETPAETKSASVSELVESTPTPTVYTDVNVVPEHKLNGFEEAISNLQGKSIVSALLSQSLDKKRREALNKILDIKGSIRVFCCVRPFLPTDRRKFQPVSHGSENIIVRSVGIRKEFSFDKVFPQGAAQEDVFIEVEPILRSALDGHNVCIFAYGQTGTGKTFTMEGTTDCLGIVPRAIEELFHQASQDSTVPFTFSMSMLEVYMGTVRDLLVQRPHTKIGDSFSKCWFYSSLNIHTGSNGSVEIEGLTDVPITDFTQANKWYTKGKRARSTSWTNVNEASSRSHCLTRITIHQSGDGKETKVQPSKLWMVDLGGSERVLKTGAAGQTLDEGKAINLSLSALGDVIAALKRKRNHFQRHIKDIANLIRLSGRFGEWKNVGQNYFRRYSDNLCDELRADSGDGSKALMLVHISPSEEDTWETICSLNFATRARAIESNRELPEDLKKLKEKRIIELELQMRDSEGECQKIRNQILAAELLLQEKRKLHSHSSVLHDQGESPKSPQVDYPKATESPRNAENGIRRSRSDSLPRFMSSTVCSRQRKGIDGEISKSVRTPRSGHGSSVELFGSQSLSFPDHHFRVHLRKTKTKLMTPDAGMSGQGELNSALKDNTNCSNLGSRSLSIPRNKRVSMSNPSLRVTMCHHRRRMSDLC
ncbi:hypothetical protein ACLOJK_026078 [Asimina triloba]